MSRILRVGLHAGLCRWWSARVGPHVTSDHVSATGGVGAGGTAVGLLARVRPLVRREVIWAREHLPARSARVRLHPTVQPRMTCQHVGTRKTPVADLTLVSSSGVGSPAAVPGRDVLSQPIVNTKCLSASAADVSRTLSELLLGLQLLRCLWFDGQVERRIVRRLRRLREACLEHEPARGRVVVVVAQLHGEFVKQAWETATFVLVAGAPGRGRCLGHASSAPIAAHRRPHRGPTWKQQKNYLFITYLLAIKNIT